MSVDTGKTSSASSVLNTCYNTGTRYGVLLVTEGAPDSLSLWHVWRFLEAQYSNRRLVDFAPMWLWRPLLYAHVLPFRLLEVMESYRSTWVTPPTYTPRSVSSVLQERNTAARSRQGSTTGVASAVQLTRLLGRRLELWMQNRLQRSNSDVSVQIEVGFYHSDGSIASALERLRLYGNYGDESRDSAGEAIRTHTEHLIILPLYPHYTSVRSAAVWDAVTQCGYFQQQRSIPNVNFIRSYSHHSAYVEAWHRHIRRFIGEQGKPDWLFVVFEAVPIRFTRFGDTCKQEYTRTLGKLRDMLSVPSPKANLSECSAIDGGNYFSDVLDPSRVVGGYLGQGGEQQMEPRIDKVLVKILKHLLHRAATSSQPTSARYREISESLCDSTIDSKSLPSSDSSRINLPHTLMPRAYVVCPGVAVDDVNTLWTIEQRLCPHFQRIGWKEVRYIPALNDSSAHVEMLAAVISSHMQ
ncbi:hypothetical protein JKF63_00768 [Porcisia hertigi]|uniref:Ferrochelatase n=1 Tax=Porcisia hertigi TaxID=2761500 RepID=A0A836I5H0_9TRYP|nr:hypothetical protein JKF63_00768 [Porcisia hertigi]